MEQRRRLVITLSKDAYRVLQRVAERDERATDQQASYLLRRVLEEGAAGTTPSVEEAAVAIGG